jgi:hypothetical protein
VADEIASVTERELGEPLVRVVDDRAPCAI